MSQGPDHRQLVGSLRQHPEILGKIDTGNIRRDRLEWAANRVRSKRLRVKSINLTRPAPHEQEQTLFCPAETMGRFKPTRLQ